MTPMRLEPAASRSRVKQSTTEPQHFKKKYYCLGCGDGTSNSNNTSAILAEGIE